VYLVYLVYLVHIIMQMPELLFDIRIRITRLDENVWYKLYLHDTEFRKYAVSDVGRRDYISCFTIKQKKSRFNLYILIW
jgi:hypothetical protein